LKKIPGKGNQYRFIQVAFTINFKLYLLITEHPVEWQKLIGY